MYARPRLEVNSIAHIVDRDVARRDVLHDFVAIWVLADGPNGDPEASVEVAILDQDVGAVSFGADRVVAIVDSPSTECNVVCIDSVCAVRLPT